MKIFHRMKNWDIYIVSKNHVSDYLEIIKRKYIYTMKRYKKDTIFRL